MPTNSEIRIEALKFRELIERCNAKNTDLILDCFPVMSCKLASMLLCYHFLNLWNQIEVIGVSGFTGTNNKVSHYWLEIGELVVDITGDQYNIIQDNELTSSIVNCRPFSAVHVGTKQESHLYRLFGVRKYESFVSGFPTVSRDFYEKMECDYSNVFQRA